MRYVLDTHVWVWWHVQPERLSPAAHAALAPAAGNELLLPAICVWEFAKLVEKGRIAVALPTGRWVDLALRMPGLRLAPLTPEVSVASAALPGDFHSDPADQMIVATARIEGATLITADERIRAYPHVATRW